MLLLSLNRMSSLFCESKISHNLDMLREPHYMIEFCLHYYVSIMSGAIMLKA